MGSLSSRPKVPQIQPQSFVAVTPQNTVQQTPSTIISQPPPVVTPQPNTAETDSTNTLPITTDAARVENLLRRNRGITGTILTGFRGLLSPNDLTPRRKTLLGE